MAWGDQFAPGSFGPPLVDFRPLGELFSNAVQSYAQGRKLRDEWEAPDLVKQLLNAQPAAAQTPLQATFAQTGATGTGQVPAAPAAATGPYNAAGKVPSFLAPIVERAAAETGVSPAYLTRTAQIESGFNPNARNPSGASGLMQFMPSTAKAYGLTDPFDPQASILAGARLAADNARRLKAALGRDPSDAELYVAHQQGAGGASALFRNPDANVVEALAPVYGGDRGKAARAVVQNGGRTSMTAGEFASLWTGKFGATGPTAAFTPQTGPEQPLNGPLASMAGLGAPILPQGLAAPPGPSVTPFRGASPDMPTETVPPMPAGQPMVAQSVVPSLADVPAVGAQPAQFVVPGDGTPLPPARPAEPAAPAAPAPIATPLQAINPASQRELIAALWANQTTRPLAAQMLQSLINPQAQYDFIQVADSLVRVNKRTGVFEVLPGLGKPLTPTIVPKGSVALDPRTSQPVYQNKEDDFRPLTSVEERRRFGIPDDDKRPYQVGPDGKLSTPGGQNINIDNKAESSEAAELGKAAGKSTAEVFAAANGAGPNLQRIARIGALLGQIKTGKLTPAQMTVASWGQALGMSDEALRGLGLDPKLPATGEAIGALVNQATVGAIGPGGFPANNFSDADRKFLADTMPKLTNTPGGNELILETWRRTEELKIEKAKALQAWRKTNKGGSFFDFETDWSEKMAKRDVFADLGKKAEKLVGTSGLLDEARDAIARGAPRDAVIKRLRERGIDPSGL